MGHHSNKKIKKHIENSNELVKKMNELTETLLDKLKSQFKTDMGVDIPTAVNSDVREIDIAMVYSTDPTVDEYMSGANSILGAAFSGDEAEIVTKSLDFVGDVLNKVIGSSSIQVGIYSSSGTVKGAKGKEYIVACYTSNEMCSSKEWLTNQDFYVCNYCLVVWEKK